jgi:hypothetical protein
MDIERNSYIDALESIGREIYHLNRQLEGVVHPYITKKLDDIYELCEKEIAPIIKAENNARNRNMNALSKIQEENNLMAAWSMSITASELHQLTPPISKITYESWGPTQIKTFDEPTQMTWLEFWKIANKMMVDSTDTHHVFIENLYHAEGEPEDHFYLSVGS